MQLTADDVRHRQFRPAPLLSRGYDEAEVDDFLDEVVAALLERDARLQIPRPAGTGGGHRTVDADPAAAATALLVLAERTAAEHVAAGAAAAADALAQAEREAAATLAAAEGEARRMVAHAQHHLQDCLSELLQQVRNVPATGKVRELPAVLAIGQPDAH